MKFKRLSSQGALAPKSTNEPVGTLFLLTSQLSSLYWQWQKGGEENFFDKKVRKILKEMTNITQSPEFVILPDWIIGSLGNTTYRQYPEKMSITAPFLYSVYSRGAEVVV